MRHSPALAASLPIKLVLMPRAATDKDDHLQNQLKAVRTRLGLSQQELARAAGIARQTIGGIEAGLYAPSAAVALRLARALGCGMEEIFWLPDAPDTSVHARLAQTKDSGPPSSRVLLGQVDGEWVAHSLGGSRAFRSDMTPADGIALPPSGKKAAGENLYQLLESPEVISRTLFLAGCSPILSLWARAAERWLPGLRIAWIHANSTEALHGLARGELHIAGLHLSGGNENAVRRMLPGRDITLVHFGVWEEGLLIARGNPKKIGGAEHLAKKGVRFVNREPGSGARQLLDEALSRAKVHAPRIHGYEVCVNSHQEVASAVAAGQADVGVATAAVAIAYGLDFLPLKKVPYDLALPSSEMERDDVRQMLGTLQHRWVRSQLQVLGGYDTSQTGEIVAKVSI